MKTICSIYRSPKKEGMYLYVDKREQLERVPESLLQLFGTPEFAMTLVLHPQRKLARVDINSVLHSLEEKGYYLQMPPEQDPAMQALRHRNSKLNGS